MKEVNKKILGVLVALMAVAMLATPLVSAKPSAEKNNPKFMQFVWHTTNPQDDPAGGSTPVSTKINPPWATPNTPEVKATHTQAIWILDPSGEHYVQIGTDQYPIDPDTGYEGYLYVQTAAISPTLIGLNYRVYEKIMWEDNYIEIMALERASYDLSGPFPVFYASGTFNGHGEIDGQKVQVMGIREGYFDLISNSFVLDNVGTIQFLGNAP